LIKEVSSKKILGTDANRWHELELYRHADGRCILHVGYRTEWEGEAWNDEVLISKSDKELADQIKSISPTQHVVRFPLEDQYREKQARMERDIERRFNEAAEIILNEIKPERI